MKFTIKFFPFITTLVAVAAIYAGCTKGPDIKDYTYPAPEPKAMFPDSGYGGYADLTITGSQFGDYKNAVKVFFNGTKADTVLSCEDGKIVVRVPANAVSGKVSLQVWTHTIDSVGAFKVKPTPVIRSVSEKAGVPGDIILISGANFGSDLTKVNVSINGTPANITAAEDSLLKVVVPANFTTGNIVLTVDDFKITGPNFGPLVAIPSPIYWLDFENNLNDRMGGAAATYTYSATDGTAKPIAYADGVKGKAVRLAGTGNRSTLNGQNSNNQFIASPPQISKLPEITVTAWVNWGSLDHPDSVWYQEPVFDFGQARGNRMALMTRMAASTGPNMVGRLIFENITGFTGFNPYDVKGTKSLPRNAWHHVAMTISTANHLLKIYLNGDMIGSLTLPDLASPTLFNHNKVYIGAPTNGVRNEPAFGGLIDNFRIYNEALTADQIYTDLYKK